MNLAPRLKRLGDRILLLGAALGAIALLFLAIHLWYGVLGVRREHELVMLLFLPLLPKAIDRVMGRRMRKPSGDRG